jgi:hypothetical protein
MMYGNGRRRCRTRRMKPTLSPPRSNPKQKSRHTAAHNTSPSPRSSHRVSAAASAQRSSQVLQPTRTNYWVTNLWRSRPYARRHLLHRTKRKRTFYTSRNKDVCRASQVNSARHDYSSRCQCADCQGCQMHFCCRSLVDSLHPP